MRRPKRDMDFFKKWTLCTMKFLEIDVPGSRSGVSASQPSTLEHDTILKIARSLGRMDREAVLRILGKWCMSDRVSCYHKGKSVSCHVHVLKIECALINTSTYELTCGLEIIMRIARSFRRMERGLYWGFLICGVWVTQDVSWNLYRPSVSLWMLLFWYKNAYRSLFCRVSSPLV